MTPRCCIMGAVLLVAAAIACPARAGVVSVETAVDADSVTVGERFTVTWDVTAPDSLRMVPPSTVEMERTRVVSMDWNERGAAGSKTYTGRLTAMTLDLEEASVPAVPFAFVTPGGDTVRASSRAVAVPVRRVAPDTVDMASLHPLKEPWEAPRSMLAWIVAAAAALALVVLVWWLWRRRRRRPVEAAPEPALPADYVALTELTRIERLGLVERGEFKEYYTLVVDVLRHYLEARFGIDAMDRTTGEVLDDARAIGAAGAPLEAVLQEADLVKFARYQPAAANATAAMRTAREYVSHTAPHHAPPHADDAAKAQVG